MNNYLNKVVLKKVGVPEQFNWGINSSTKSGENGFPNRKRIKLDSYT